MIALSHQTMAEGDVSKGEKLFKVLHCASCHSLEGGDKKAGPPLTGLFGRKSGSVEGFEQYSEAMVNAGIIWEEDTLSAFLANPKKLVPGNRMGIRRIYSAQQRADVIAYLREATAP